MKTIHLLSTTLSIAAAGVLLLAGEAPAAKPKAPTAPPLARPMPAKTQPKPSAETNSAPIITHLETRDQFITLRSGPQGTLYTVRLKKDGRVVHQDLSEKDLQAKAPELYDFVKKSLASGGKKGGPVVDASVHHSGGR